MLLAAFGPNNCLATYTHGRVDVWDTEGRPLHSIMLSGEDRKDVDALLFSPDGNWLAVFQGAYRILLYNLKERQRTWQRDMIKIYCELEHASFSPDSQHLAVCIKQEQGCAILIFDTATGKNAHRLAVGECPGPVAWLPDGQHLLAREFGNGWLLSLEGAPAKKFKLPDQHAFQVAAALDGAVFVTRDFRSAVRIYDLETHKLRFEVKPPSADINIYQFALDGARRTLFVFMTKSVEVYDLATAEKLHSFPLDTPPGDKSNAVSLDGKLFATGDPDLRLWDAETGRPVLRHSRHARRVRQLLFDPVDGERLFSLADDNRPRAWFFKTGKPISTPWESEPALSTGGGGKLMLSPDMTALAVSPDGRYIVTAEQHGYLLLYDAKTFELLSWASPSNYINALAFRPDSQALFVADQAGLCTFEFPGGQIKEKPVRFWSLRDGQRAHLALSPNQRWLALNSEFIRDLRSDRE